MKILTTQNLNLNLNQTNQQSTNALSQKDFRFNKQIPYYSFEKGISSSNITFGKRIPYNKKVMQTVEKAAKIAKENAKIAANKGKDPVDGKLNRFLEKTTEQEVLITAAVSAVLAGIMRPLTLMLIADDKSKTDMAYASGHAISSAIWGLLVPAIFIRPLAGGYNKVFKFMHQHLKPSEIQKKFAPQLDLNNTANYVKVKDVEKYLTKAQIKSGKYIIDRAKPENFVTDKDGDKVLKQLMSGKNFDGIWVQGCIDRAGNDLLVDIKNVYKIPLPKHVSEISEETSRKYFNEGGSIKSLDDVFIALVDESKASKLGQKRTWFDKLFNRKTLPKYYNLGDCTKEVWAEAFPGVNLETVGEAGSRDLSKIRNKDGSQFVLDKSLCYISDWAETNKSVPYSTGETFDWVKTSLFSKKNKKSKKDVCYQQNGPNHTKGTPIEKDMAIAAGQTEVQNKIGGWLPDIVIAYPRAAATIALIPFILKNVFHLEKKPKVKKEVA